MSDSELLRQQLLRGKSLSKLLTIEGIPPVFLLGADTGDLFRGVLYTDFRTFYSTNRIGATLKLLISRNWRVNIPGIPDITLGIGDDLFTSFSVTASWQGGVTSGISLQDFKLVVQDIVLSAFISRTLLLPAERTESGNFRVIEGEDSVSISMKGTLYVDGELNIDTSGFDQFALTPLKIPGTNSIYIEIDNIKFDFSRASSIAEVESVGFGKEFQGIYIGSAEIHFQDELEGLPNLTANDFVIGSSGVAGRVAAEWEVALDADGTNFVTDDTDVLIDLFGHQDMQMGLQSVAIQFEKSFPVEFSVRGLLKLPYFDSIVEAEITLGDNGDLLIGIRGLGTDGLLKLTKEQLFELQVNAMMLRRTSEETAFVVNGEFQITNDEVKKLVPKFGLEGLSIYKRTGGNWSLRIEGGTVEVNKSINLFNLARADVKEIGIGDLKDGTRVLEFSGGLALEGIDASGWVYGLRVPLEGEPKLGLDGIGLEMVVPNTLEFRGEAIYVDEAGTAYFQGSIALNVIPTQLGIAASIKVGRNPRCRFAFLSAEVLFPPPGVPLAQIPIYITSVGGLIGVNVEPDADTVLDLVPLFQRPPKGLTDASKWRDKCGAHAIGFGVGLSAANPTLINISALMAFAYPELLLFIEGKAFVLEPPKPGKEPPFHSLIAMDIDEPSALIFVEADYEFIKGVIDAQGVCEVYYGPDPDIANKTISYFALGKVGPHFPTNQPIEAKVLQLFGARAYLYISPDIWDLGGEIALRKRKYGFSFANVHFEAFIKGRGTVNWGPNQFSGFLQLSGNVGFRVFKIGFDLSLGARVEGKTPDWLVDARIWFGVKFKILWKKYEFGGTIPFRWEKRITPPVPELLKEIQVKSLIEDTSTTPYLAPDGLVLPDQGVVPEVEPDTAPALAFHFRTKDRTELPFGQDVEVVPDHKSGDHTFRGELLEIQFSRMKIRDWKDGKDSWEHFQPGFDEDGLPGFINQSDAKPILYGAWQATQDPEGIPGATELHLFARSPFDYNRPSRLRTEAANVMMNQNVLLENGESVARSSDTATAALQNAANSLIDETTGGTDNSTFTSNALVKVPYYQSSFKDQAELSNLGKSLPYRAAQQAVNEQSHYPHSGVAEFDKEGKPIPREDRAIAQCLNFLQTSAGYRRPDEVIFVDGTAEGLISPKAGDVLIGGYADASIASGGARRVGSCEIVRDEMFAYPFQYLEWHDDSAIDSTTGNIVTIDRVRQGRLKILIRDQVKQLTIHYETIWEDGTLPTYTESVLGKQCSEDARLRFRSTEPIPTGTLKLKGAFRKLYSSENFWRNGKPVKPSPRVDNNTYGKLVISADSIDGGFNEVLFDLSTKVRIYSICYQADLSEEFQDKDDQLEGYINVTWPGRGRDDGDGAGWQPGPDDLSHGRFRTPEGGVEPGYLYRLKLRTNHERIQKNPSGPTPKEYRAFFSVPRPPSNLTPYVVTSFPRGDKFPHYRSHELYLRMFRNYVHKLMGDQNDRVVIEIRREGEVIESLPFQDGKHSNLGNFLANTSNDRKGWGWGKAGDGHLLTPEEKVWMNAYNASAPAERHITEEMALPDDMIWAYPVSPVLLRSEFSSSDSNGDSINGFLPPIDEEGSSIEGRWEIFAATLKHLPTETPEETEVPESYLLTETEFDESYVCSVWIRPVSNQTGDGGSRVALVLAATQDANNHLLRYILVSIDIANGRISLIQKNANADPAIITKVEKRFSLPIDRWSRISARVAMVSGKAAITVHYSGDQIFSVSTDLTELRGRVGLMAHPHFRGRFDSLEVLSVDRLSKLPSSGAMHQLVIKYQAGDNKNYEIHKLDFRASLYLDLFDHLNAWDRNVFRSQADVTTNEATIRQSVDDWVQANEALIDSLGDLDLIERQYVVKLASLEDVEKHREALREARFNLDEHFQEIAGLLSLELSPRPERFEFILSKNDMALLIQSPEPIDWLRIDCEPLRKSGTSTGGENGSEAMIATRFTYSSDLTRAILILQPDGGTIQPFQAGATYVWTIKEYAGLPPHLGWLDGWVWHRKKDHELALEIPDSQ